MKSFVFGLLVGALVLGGMSAQASASKTLHRDRAEALAKRTARGPIAGGVHVYITRGAKLNTRCNRHSRSTFICKIRWVVRSTIGGPTPGRAKFRVVKKADSSVRVTGVARWGPNDPFPYDRRFF